MISRKIRLSLAILSALAFTVPAAAQLGGGSDAQKFLKAVKDAKAQDVEDALSKPGNIVIDSHDLSTGEGALHIVVRRGDTTYLSFLLQHGADPNIRDKQGVTPMILAVNLGQEPCVQVLIADHANVNLANDRGETPLIRAVQMHNIAVVRDLLNAGADPDQTDHIAGLSARDYAARDTRSPAVAKLLADAAKAKKATIEGPQLR